ncbi:MAG: hypothetical protein ACI4DQ_10240 [Lachnospiraceae bacterium]
MQRILYKSICRKFTESLFFILMIVAAQYYGNLLLGMNLGIYITGVLISGQTRNFLCFDVPCIFFILPLSKEERRSYVRAEFFSIWIFVGGVYIALLGALGWSYAVLVIPEGIKVGWLLLLVSLIFSAVYISLYGNYLERIKSIHSATLILGLLVKVPLTLVLLNTHDMSLNLQGIMILLAAGMSFSIDFIFTRKFYQKMLAFYADFELSRGILSERRL